MECSAYPATCICALPPAVLWRRILAPHLRTTHYAPSSRFCGGAYLRRIYALRTPHYAPRTTHYALRTTHYALRTTHYALRTTHPALRTLLVSLQYQAVAFGGLLQLHEQIMTVRDAIFAFEYGAISDDLGDQRPV
jgi:hypothetical protein